MSTSVRFSLISKNPYSFLKIEYCYIKMNYSESEKSDKFKGKNGAMDPSRMNPAQMSKLTQQYSKMIDPKMFAQMGGAGGFQHLLQQMTKAESGMMGGKKK